MIGNVSKYDRPSSVDKRKDIHDDLKVYLENSFGLDDCNFQIHQLRDEPQVDIWNAYIKEADRIGVFSVLKKYFVQFCFPIEDGISQTQNYRRATLRGESTSNLPEASGLHLESPHGLKLFLHNSLAGRIPVLIVDNRKDFESIVRALTYRNEPKYIPKSMGAAMIKGINNWDRLRRSIKNYSRNKVLSSKSLYQDRIIVLSKIPYSNVSARTMGLAQEEWLKQSLQIRLHHECAHYFTLRHFGKMSNHLHDEIVADYMGITSVLPAFSSDWFLKFMGLEGYPDFNQSGRLNNYIESAHLSKSSTKRLRQIIFYASKKLEIFDAMINEKGLDPKKSFRLQTLCTLDLIQMASDDGVSHLLKNFDQLSQIY